MVAWNSANSKKSTFNWSVAFAHQIDSQRSVSAGITCMNDYHHDRDVTHRRVMLNYWGRFWVFRGLWGRVSKCKHFCSTTMSTLDILDKAKKFTVLVGVFISAAIKWASTGTRIAFPRHWLRQYANWRIPPG